MRSKTLLLTAALGAAGLTTAAAQNGDVVSANAVGFVNVELPEGFEMVANPLDAEDNSVAALFGDVPEGTILYTFDSDAGAFELNSLVFGEWDNPDQTLEPGEGVFINTPEAGTTITFVGEVPQGTLETDLPAGFSIKSSQVPQAGGLETDLGFPTAEGDIVYTWDNDAGSYNLHSFAFGEWDEEPQVDVAQAFWVNKAEDATWTREFSISE